jgi:hypothetical protein
MATYARDVILTRQGTVCSQIAAQYADKTEAEQARERLNLLQRTPANTLSSNVAGLSPAQHIAQIFQVIDSSRPLVASAISADLVRGTLTYPQVDTTPVVAVQGTQKTEAGTPGWRSHGHPQPAPTSAAATCPGRINWSTRTRGPVVPVRRRDYALKTERRRPDPAALGVLEQHAHDQWTPTSRS